MTALLPRRWTLLIAVLALLGAIVPVTPAQADAGAESQFVALINQERAARGLPAVQVSGDLTAVARRHSERMASSSNLHHNPNLGGDVSGWQKVGENVGRGPGASAIHQGFMNSPSHKQNVLDAAWTQVGVGVVVRNGQVWVTEVFRLPASQAPAPAPKPEPKPEPAPAPAPEPEPTPASDTSGDAGASDGPARESDRDTDRDVRSAGSADDVEEQVSGPRHRVTERPTGLDRGLLTLARLEAAERNSSISAALD